jgi:hypothetical protein
MTKSKKPAAANPADDQARRLFRLAQALGYVLLADDAAGDVGGDVLRAADSIQEAIANLAREIVSAAPTRAMLPAAVA